MSENKAIELMRQQPSLIKRPVLAHGGKILVGFDEQVYRTLFAK
jgi:arsenate reductase